MPRLVIVATVALLLGSMPIFAQRRLPVASMYRLIEKVVLEPSDESPERMQVWGAFAFVVEHLDTPNAPLEISKAARGYMYFKLPSDTRSKLFQIASTEWKSVKAAAGSTEVIGFGGWCGGDLTDVDPRDSRYIRVRPLVEPVVNPEEYVTESSAARRVSDGQYVELVQRLRNALR